MNSSMMPVAFRRIAVSAAVVALLFLAGAWGAGAAPVGAAGCGPAPAGSIATMMVVDNGGTPSQRCVVVPDRSTGYDALRSAGHQLRIESGFLCAIDGVPATGCGNQSNFNGAYWRYFHADPGGSWIYSTVGGGGYRLPARCAIEGWRWSTAGSNNTPPRVAPPQVACEVPSTAPPTTAQRPPATPAPAPTQPRSGSGGASTPGGGQGGAPAPPPADGGLATGSQTPGGQPGPAQPGVTQPGPAQPGGATADPGAAPTTIAGAATAGDPATGDESGADVADDDPDGAGAVIEQADGVPAAATSRGSSPLGLIAGVVAICAIGGAAVYRTRRRSADESAS